MLRFGILSTAKISRDHVAPAIFQASNARVEAIASRDVKKARRLAKNYNAPLAFGSYEELLASDSVDAVYIPLPTSQHVEWTIKATQAGKHVLCEKPIALKASDIKRLIKARDKAGVVVSEAFMVTYHPQWLKVKELLAKGAIGKLRMIDASFTYFNTDSSNMRNRPELGGGALPDIGVYPVVTARFATGLEPLTVNATVEFDPTLKLTALLWLTCDSIVLTCVCMCQHKWVIARAWCFMVTKDSWSSVHHSIPICTKAMKSEYTIRHTTKLAFTAIQA